MAERGKYGAGSVIEVGKGKWRVVVDAPADLGTGKRRQVVRTFYGSQRDALKFKDTLRAELNGGTRTTKATVDQMLDRYMREAQGELSDKAWDDYERALRHIVRPCVGRLALDKVTTAELDRMWKWATDHGYSRHRQRKAATALSSAYRHAIRWTWTTANPVPHAKPRPPTRKRPRVPPNVDVLKRLLAAVEGDVQLHAWLRLAIAMGARRGEVLALRWSDVDLTTGEVDVERALSYAPHAGVTAKTTKTNRERTVTLDAASLTVLAALHAERPEAAARGGYVLAADLDGNQPWFPDSASRRFRKLRSRVSGAEAVQLKDLRSAAATHMLEAGVPLPVAADRLGHDPVVLLHHYAGSMRASERAAADKMGDLLA